VPSRQTTLLPGSRSRQLSSSFKVAAEGRDLVEPAFVSVPDGYDERRTLGPEVGAIATLAGFAPDPEQQFMLDVSFALDKRGRPLVFDTTIVAPRQNVKTGFEKQRALGKLYVTKRRLIVWSAHEFGTAQEAARDIEGLVEQCEPLRSRVVLTNRGDVMRHGTTPQIELRHKDRSSSRLIFKTRTSGGGRGLAGDDLFVDEAYAAQAAQMGAVMPIMLARPGAQVDFASSACRPESAFLWGQIQQVRLGGARSFYIEWCAPPPEVACDLGEDCDHARGRDGCGCDKPEVIVLAHTAVTRGRIEMQTVLDLRRTMPQHEYPREVMGWHDEVVDDASEMPFTLEAWQALLLAEADDDLDVEADVPPAEVATFGIEMDVDRAFTSITGAADMDAKDDDRKYVEFVERRRGRAWVVPRCREIANEHPGAVFAGDGGGPAAPILAELAEAGLDVIVLSAADVVEANSDFVDFVNDGGLVHGPQFEMDAAVEGARKRPLGDRGFTIGRRASDDDPSPLLAGVYAVWAIGKGSGPNLW
jgi:hypothetical protein